ncbi:hypothetical protein FQR65_LT07207 [Abscondita terminalis]|nr:hypothetical protein FQR65_LT07207 [Abscondita terminalis]
MADTGLTTHQIRNRREKPEYKQYLAAALKAAKLDRSNPFTKSNMITEPGDILDLSNPSQIHSSNQVSQNSSNLVVISTTPDLTSAQESSPTLVTERSPATSTHSALPASSNDNRKRPLSSPLSPPEATRICLLKSPPPARDSICPNAYGSQPVKLLRSSKPLQLFKKKRPRSPSPSVPLATSSTVIRHCSGDNTVATYSTTVSPSPIEQLSHTGLSTYSVPITLSGDISSLSDTDSLATTNRNLSRSVPNLPTEDLPQLTDDESVKPQECVKPQILSSPPKKVSSAATFIIDDDTTVHLLQRLHTTKNDAHDGIL